MPDLKRLKDFYDELLSEFKKHAYERDILCCKKPLSQLIELVRLRIGAGKLIPEDYYRYRLYDDNLFSNKEKKLFASPCWYFTFLLQNLVKFFAIFPLNIHKYVIKSK